MAGWQEEDVEPENEEVVRVKIGPVADSAKAFQSKPKGEMIHPPCHTFGTLAPCLLEKMLTEWSCLAELFPCLLVCLLVDTFRVQTELDLDVQETPLQKFKRLQFELEQLSSELQVAFSLRFRFFPPHLC